MGPVATGNPALPGSLRALAAELQRLAAHLEEAPDAFMRYCTEAYEARVALEADRSP